MSLSPCWARAAGTIACVVLASAGQAQVGTPAAPQVGSPTVPLPSGPPAPPQWSRGLPGPAPVEGPLPAVLTLDQALREAEARSPTIVAARARVEAAEARIRQAGFRTNPELSLEVENLLGTGELSGLQGDRDDPRGQSAPRPRRPAPYPGCRRSRRPGDRAIAARHRQSGPCPVRSRAVRAGDDRRRAAAHRRS